MTRAPQRCAPGHHHQRPLQQLAFARKPPEPRGRRFPQPPGHFQKTSCRARGGAGWRSHGWAWHFPQPSLLTEPCSWGPRHPRAPLSLVPHAPHPRNTLLLRHPRLSCAEFQAGSSTTMCLEPLLGTPPRQTQARHPLPGGTRASVSSSDAPRLEGTRLSRPAPSVGTPCSRPACGQVPAALLPVTS